ncbi:flagellar basal-body rod protein FlgF [Sulfurivermis fontis]|jgi:flagellar basal-body rod protein FlgF|uniref:flagellar basal-body rod protein FlgF n=1 Tax=Sulfurivermis fontis TaxID=1972068 RepID=UPI000FD79B06|nr:flagellar basal-body rod protein FlgF [Sulfurivermis fontis]
MDRMLYLSMNGASQIMQAQAITTNNLANVSTTGFKADLAQFRSMPVFGPGMPSRVYAMTERPGTDLSSGAHNHTGRELDMAVRGDGWIAVQAPDGSEAYTRAGDLHISSAGLLVNGAGHPILGDNGGPIAIPPYEKIDIATDGTITIRPLGQQANVLAQVERIKLVLPEDGQLTKGEDGLMRLKGGGVLPPDASVQLVSGVLETSNVSVVDSMVRLIELSRQYETQVKMMNTAKENDASSDRLMQLA